MSDCKSADQFALHDGQRGTKHDQPAICLTRECRNAALYLAGVAHADWTHLHAERRCHGLDGARLTDSGGYGGIPKHSHPRHVGRDLLEQLQPFPASAEFLPHGKAGGVAARARQALDEAGVDRIRDLYKYDRHRATRLLQRRHRAGAGGLDDVRREGDQFRRVSATALDIRCSKAVVNPDVTAVCPSQLLQSLQQRPHARLCLRIVLRQVHQHADAPHPLSLLRLRPEWPCRRRASEQRNELAASHSITSSASASSDGGTVRPSALAVLRLMTRSYLVGACTGRSPGLVPLRMWST